MQELTKVFNYEERPVRTVMINNEPWFVAKDVCEILELSDVSMTTQRLDEDEKLVQKLFVSGQNRDVLTINEAGLYSLILTSNKPEAKVFKRWITHEVIPTIRKTGGYVSNDDMFISVYLPFADDTTKTLFKSTLEIVKTQNTMIEKQQKEIEHKENVIIGLVDEIDLATKRQILNQVVRYKGAEYGERWRMLYSHFEMKYRVNLNRRLASYNEKNTPKLKNKLEYVDKVLEMIPQLYEIAAKLFENDVKSLVNELYAIN